MKAQYGCHLRVSARKKEIFYGVKNLGKGGPLVINYIAMIWFRLIWFFQHLPVFADVNLKINFFYSYLLLNSFCLQWTATCFGFYNESHYQGKTLWNYMKQNRKRRDFFSNMVVISYKLKTVCVYICIYIKVKVKVTLEQATKAQRGSRCIAVLFL